jgi:thymidylate synthase (FAD)
MLSLSKSNLVSNASRVLYANAPIIRHPLGDKESLIEILPGDTNDLAVVNAARVSFNRTSTNFTTIKDKPKGSDEALLNFLARENHWTPFAHPSYVFMRHLPKDDFILYVNNAKDYQFDRHIFPIEGSNVRFIERGSAYAYIATCLDSAVRGGDPKHPHPFRCEMDPIYHMMADMPYTLLSFSNAKQVQFPSYLHHDTLKRCRRITHDFEQHTQNMKTAESLATISLRIKMPIFVERQWFKHTQGFIRSSVSRRYVRDLPEFFTPSDYRLQDVNVKQGSSDGVLPMQEFLDIDTDVHQHNLRSVTLYQNMRNKNVCAEQSRIVFPQSMYTEFIETGTIAAYKRLLHLRLAKVAQKEIRDYASALLEMLSDPEVTHYHNFFK